MSIFYFKHFSINQSRSALKVGTDAMVLGASVEGMNPRSILDIGAGTGVLSLMMTQKFHDALITAIEIDKESYLDCQHNFEKSPWPTRVTAVNCDILEFFPNNQYDLIVTNPPFYLDSLTNDDLKKAKAKHSVHLPFDQLIDKISQLLSETGTCWLIIPIEAKDRISELALRSQLCIHSTTFVLGKPGLVKRVIFSFGKKGQTHKENTLIIRNEEGNYSEQYIELTKEFHAVDLSQKA